MTFQPLDIPYPKDNGINYLCIKRSDRVCELLKSLGYTERNPTPSRYYYTTIDVDGEGNHGSGLFVTDVFYGDDDPKAKGHYIVPEDVINSWFKSKRVKLMESLCK